MDDFDHLDLIHKNGEKTSHYKVMLREENARHKYENLLVLNHADGVNYCREHFDNGTLLTIQSAQESALLIDWLFYKMKIPGKVWLGLGRITKTATLSHYYNRGTTSNSAHLFLWDDDSCVAEFSNWNKCEPNNAGGNENCAEMLPTFYPYPVGCDVAPVVGKWNDVVCDSNIKNVVVCKKFA